jgi:RNA polymerase sigma-70 factor, ECF subfamily
MEFQISRKIHSKKVGGLPRANAHVTSQHMSENALKLYDVESVAVVVETPETEHWLPRCLPVDREEEDEFVQKLQPLIRRVVRRHLPRRESEEDMVQSVFLRVWQKFHQYSGRVPLVHWVSRVAVNTCLNQISKEKHRPELRHADLSEEQSEIVSKAASGCCTSPDDEVASREQVNSLLSRLTAEDRLILYLRLVERQSVRRVSQITGLSSGAVKLRTLRARRKLQKRLDRPDRSRSLAA